MTTSHARPAFASDDWMREQQLRAELEAEAWRRLRLELTAPEPPPPTAQPEPRRFDHHRAGSTMLKALVRFGLGAFTAYLSWIAAQDSQLGEFEVWLAVGATFLVTLSLSMFGFARELVHTLAEAARWAILLALALGGIWLATSAIA